MKFRIIWVTIILFFSYSNCQFYLTNPIGRGFNENALSKFPCGGFNVSEKRENILDSGATFRWNITEQHGLIQIAIGYGFNPSTFVPTSLQVNCEKPGSFNLTTDFEEYLLVDHQATIHFTYNALFIDNDTSWLPFFQCVDVLVVSAAPTTTKSFPTKFHSSTTTTLFSNIWIAALVIPLVFLLFLGFFGIYCSLVRRKQPEFSVSYDKLNAK